jgi:hypothetical protein
MQADSASGGDMGSSQAPKTNVWRALAWGGAAALWLLPLVAMQLTRDVQWTALDFTVFGIMLLLACGTVELGLRMSGNLYYRAGMGLAAAAGFLLVWINIAVGVIGDEGNPANLMFAGVLLVGILVGLIGRLQPAGMVRALVVTAIAQALVGVICVLGSLGVEAVILCAVFTGLWLASAGLFAKAAMQQAARA